MLCFIKCIGFNRYYKKDSAGVFIASSCLRHTHSTILPNIMNDGYYSHSLTICDNNIWNVVFPALSFQNPVAFVAQLTSNKKEIVVSPKSHSKSAGDPFFKLGTFNLVTY